MAVWDKVFGSTKKRPSGSRAQRKYAAATATPVASRGRQRRKVVQRQRILSAVAARWQRTRRAIHIPNPLANAPAWLVGSGWRVQKLVSLLLLLLSGAAIGWIHQDARFFVYPEDVHFVNLHYLTADELYPLTQVETWNSFWLRPDEVQQRLLANPFVGSVRVEVFFPATVRIWVEEKEPIALWMTNGATYWLLPDGTATDVRDPNRTDLFQLFDGAKEAQAVRYDHKLAVDPNILASAQKLLTQFPALNQMRYNKGVGLNFALPNGQTWIYWGDGNQMDKKLSKLAAALEIATRQGASAQLIDLRFPDQAYYR